MIDWSKPEKLKFLNTDAVILEVSVPEQVKSLPKGSSLIDHFFHPVLVYYKNEVGFIRREFYSMDGMAESGAGNKNYAYNIIPRPKIDKVDFMSFFRDDECLSELTTDDRIEIFKSILPGADCITTELLENLLNDYGVENILAIEYKETT